MNSYKYLSVLCCIVLIVSFLSACSTSVQHAGADVSLIRKVDSLEKEIAELKEQMAPGLGELMNTNHTYIQKLAVDIETENWDYAHFHLHEMEEIFERIEELHNHHDELVQPADVQINGFIKPAFTKLESAVENKNKQQAQSEYVNLKAGCNSCHQANHMQFIVID